MESAARPITEYVEDGARIAAILLVWGFVAALFRFSVPDLGLPFPALWPQLGNLFALTGLLNAILYLCYRSIDYWHATD